jgi:L-threonylcarbamoyladenylate synthase
MNYNLQTLLLSGADKIEQASALLKKGECVALPTETVYGLAADASNPEAINKIFEAKGRPKNHPLIVHIPDISHVVNWAKDIPPATFTLAAAFWPGPLSLLLKKADHVSDLVTGGLDTIVLRVPAHPLFLEVLTQMNSALAAPSANRYKQLSPTIVEQVLQSLGGRIAAVLEGGPCDHGLESTILDLVSEKPRILRSGPISRQQLEIALGQAISIPASHLEVVPGNVKAHYQPHTPLRIATSEQLLIEIDNLSHQNTHFILLSDKVIERCKKIGVSTSNLSEMNNNAAMFGKKLYVTLFHADQNGVEQIIVEKPPQTDAWSAVNDRLSRAAAVD